MHAFIKKIKSYIVPQTPLKTRKSLKMRWIMVGFYTLLAFVIINTILMTLYFNDNEYQYTIFSHSYIEAILPEQPTNETLRTDIVRTRDFTIDNLEAGDYVVTYDRDNALLGIDRDFALVSEIVSKNEMAETLTITYDDTSAITLSSEEVIGEYVRDANFVGTYYYTSMFSRGYMLLMVSHIILLLGYYFVFIYDNPERFLPEKPDRDKPISKDKNTE